MTSQSESEFSHRVQLSEFVPLANTMSVFDGKKNLRVDAAITLDISFVAPSDFT